MDWEQVARYYQRCAVWFATNEAGTEVPEWCTCDWPGDARLVALSEKKLGWWFPESAAVPYFVTAIKQNNVYKLASYIKYHPIGTEIKKLHKTKDSAIKAADDDVKRKLSFYMHRQENIDIC